LLIKKATFLEKIKQTDANIAAMNVQIKIATN
jgi:hypothetical protein